MVQLGVQRRGLSSHGATWIAQALADEGVVKDRRLRRNRARHAKTVVLAVAGDIAGDP